MKCIICMSKQLNILCLICIYRQYPENCIEFDNVTFLHEFCSIFIQNTVKQGRSLTHMVSPDEVQHVRWEWRICRANAEGNKQSSQSVRLMVSVAVSKLGKTDLVFVQPGVKISSVYYCENQGRVQGGHGPLSLACAKLFCAWLLTFRHITQLTSKRFVNRIAEGVGITPSLPNLAQPRYNCKCKLTLTLTLDSRYNGRQMLWRRSISGDYLKQHASPSPQHLQHLAQLSQLAAAVSASQRPANCWGTAGTGHVPRLPPPHWRRHWLQAAGLLWVWIVA